MSASQMQTTLERCQLFVVVLDSSTASLDRHLGSEAEEQRDGSSGLEGILQRTVLFLDEVIDALVVLQVPSIQDDDLEMLARQLVVSLEAFAVGTRRSGVPDVQDAQMATIKDLVCSWTNINEEMTPQIIRHASSDTSGAAGGGVFVYWKVEAHLNRTRIRSSNPSLFFTASASLRNDNASEENHNEDEYVPSGVPASVNLFDAFQNDPTFNGKPPVLQASRLSKILPTGVEGRDQPRSLRNSSRRLIRLVPPFRSRIRIARIGASPNHVKIFACLDLDIAPFIDGHVDVQDVELLLSGGVAEPLNNPQSMSFPVQCKAEGCLSFVYNLIPSRARSGSTTDPTPYTLTLLLKATLAEPNNIHRHLKSTYRTPVDLSLLHKKPYFLHQPEPKQQPASSQPHDQQPLSHLITLTISSPPSTTVGATLTWSLLLSNRSATRTLDLAIIPITHSHASPSAPRPLPAAGAMTVAAATRARHAHKATLSTSLFAGAPTAPAEKGGSGTSTATTAGTTTATAAAPTDAWSSPPPAGIMFEEPSLIPLTPDTRTGALPPGASMETSMQFLVLRAGAVGVNAVRVVDLGGVDGAGAGDQRRAFVDLTGSLLPDVVALEREWASQAGKSDE